MQVVFDISGTVLGALDLSPRPGIRETIAKLRGMGIGVHFWTSGRPNDYLRLLKNFGIDGEVFSKRHELPFKADLCVDDDPQEWMPGEKYKVGLHISEELPGAPIALNEIIGGKSAEQDGRRAATVEIDLVGDDGVIITGNGKAGEQAKKVPLPPVNEGLIEITYEER